MAGINLNLPVVLPEVDWSNPLTRGLRNAYVFDGGYAFDAAKGQPAPLTAAFGTPTYAAFPGSGELALYTPNGAAASLAIAEDWSGPCTVLWRVYIESVDSPWGGLWVKMGVGTATQLTFQRNSSNNNFYTSRNYSSSLITGRTLSSLLGIPATFALTNESAAAASRLAIHLDGSLVQAFNPVEAQTGGAGTLLLGCENASSATYDSSVYWREFFRFDRELSAGEIAAIGRDPRQLLVQERRIGVPVSAAGGGTAAITPAAGAATSSTLAGSSVAAAAFTAAAGAATPATLVGGSTAASAITAAAGVATSATLVGVAGTGSAITPAAGTSTAAALAGASTAAAALTPAAGTATAATLAGASTAASAITPAAGSATAATLVGNADVAGTAAFVAATGTATASTLVGSSVAASSITAAAGSSTCSILVGTAVGAVATPEEITLSSPITTAISLSSYITTQTTLRSYLRDVL